MRVVVLALAAATLGVEAWTVMTSAIDRPLTTPSPRRKRHRAAKALPIELESHRAAKAWAAKALPIELEAPIEEAAVGEEEARRPPAKALRSRRRRQRAAPAPPSTVQNVTDDWLGQAAQRARNHRPQRAPSARRPFVFYQLRNSGGGELRDALAHYTANRSAPSFIACHGEGQCLG